MYIVKKRMSLEQISAVFFGNPDLVKCIKGEVSSRSYLWQKYFKVSLHGKMLLYLLINGAVTKEDEPIALEFILSHKGRTGISTNIKLHGCIFRKLSTYGTTPGIFYQFASDIFSKQLRAYNLNECNSFVFKVLNEEPRFQFAMACSYLDEILNLNKYLTDELITFEIESTLTENEYVDILKSYDLYKYVVTMEDMLVLSSVIKICSSTRKIQAIYNNTIEYLNQDKFKQTFGSKKINEIIEKVNNTLTSLIGSEQCNLQES